MTKVSAVVIARNEEAKIKECLASLKWVDEILVFDDSSTDKTSEIANKYTNKIYKAKGADFSTRKNNAFEKASGEWILSLDADERVTPELKEEILQLTTDYPLPTTNSAYAIPRRNIILGREFKYGGRYPDYVIRLFRKKDFTKMEGKLHEQPKFKGNLGYLKNSLLHLKHNNLSEMVEKTNEWSEVEAKLMLEAKHPPMNVIRFFTAGFREFWLRFVKQQGFRDGTEGVIYSLYQVISRLISYAKLWEMQIKK